jgi:hypothetical protein
MNARREADPFGIAKPSQKHEIGRGDLTDLQWEKLHPLLPPQKPRKGRPNIDHRQVINGIRWILRTGAPWRGHCSVKE